VTGRLGLVRQDDSFICLYWETHSENFGTWHSFGTGPRNYA